MALQVRRIEEYNETVLGACLTTSVEALARPDPIVGAANDYDPDLLRLALGGIVASSLWRGRVYAVGKGEDICALMIVRAPSDAADPHETPIGEDPGAAYRRQHDAELPSHLKQWDQNVFMPAQTEFAKARQGPASDNDYRVSFLATRPTAQRQGHGGALMRFLMDKAAREGRGVGLACQEVLTRSWYESLGFRLVHHDTLPSPQGTTINMWELRWSPPSESTERGNA